MVIVAEVTEPNFRNCLLVDYLSVAYLEALVPFAAVVPVRRECELPNAGIGLAILPKLVTGRQRIVVPKLGVKAGANIRLRLGSWNGLDQGSLVEVLVKDGSVHNGLVFDVAALPVDIE